MAGYNVCKGEDNERVRLNTVHVFSSVKRKICSFTVEVGRRSFACDKQCTITYYVCFDSWFAGIERCERESDASCQVELVLVSICVSVLAVVGLCQVQ